MYTEKSRLNHAQARMKKNEISDSSFSFKAAFHIPRSAPNGFIFNQDKREKGIKSNWYLLKNFLDSKSLRF